MRFASLSQSVEIAAPADEVYEHWMRLEELPRALSCVRRVKRIDEQRSLWDVDVASRQLVWEAAIVEQIPGKRVRWESRWGVPNAGQVSFEALPPDRTRLVVEIRFAPRGLVERLATRLGLLDVHVRSDLARFRQLVERRSEPGGLG